VSPLVIIFLTVFIDLLGFGIIIPLLPFYAESFGANAFMVGLLSTSFSLMQFLFSPVWGRLSDRIGRRPIILLGLAGSCASYMVMALASSLAVVFLGRIVGGIAGANIPTAQAYIADVTTLASRAKGMALIGAAFGLGFTFGPLIGFAALWFSANEAQVATSPWPGYAAAVLSSLACLLAVALLPESLRPGKVSEHHSFFDWRGWSDALNTPSVPAILITAFVSVVSFGAYETTLSLLLESQRFKFSFQQILLYFAFIGFTLSLAQGLLVRRLASRVSEVTMATAGGVVTILGFVLLSLATQSSRLPLLIIASAVEVIGFSLITPSVQSLVSRRSDPARQGGILGVSQGTSALARVVGPLIAVPLFFRAPEWPYIAAIAMMAAALLVFVLFARHGRDYGSVQATKER
jgi:MFS family permease